MKTTEIKAREVHPGDLLVSKEFYPVAEDNFSLIVEVAIDFDNVFITTKRYTEAFGLDEIVRIIPRRLHVML